GERRTRFPVRPPTIIGIDLDPVGALADLVAHHASEPVHSVRFLGALRDLELRGEPLRSIASGRDDRARYHDHARARNDSLLDRALETYVCVTSAFGAEVANRRE